MSLLEPTNYNTILQNDPPVNSEQEVFNRIRQSKSGKEELKKTAQEFEGIFISKMFSLMDQTVDKEGGIFGGETSYYDTFKSYMYNEVGRELAKTPQSSFGFAKQIYEQMEKYVTE